MTYASGYGVRVDAIVLEKLGELHDAPRYQDKGAFLETTHDGQGFYLERGCFWNDTEGRAATGVTKTDVRDVRAALGRMGIRLTVDQVDEMLCRAYAVTDGGSRAVLHETERAIDDKREQWRERRRKRIADLRERGLCIICGKVRVEDKSTCLACGRKANEHAKKRKRATSAR
jgi:hypothetical protein